MRKIMYLFLAVLITFLSTVPVQALNISLEVVDSYIETGESFDVQVFAQEDISAGDLLIFGFDVDPSTTLFTYDGYTVDSAFWDDGYNSFNFLDPNYVAGSTIDFNAGTNILLATLSFTSGNVAGTDTLAIEGLWDGFSQGAYYFFADADIIGATDITIHGAGATAPVPEPSTVLLMGVGLLGLAGYSRKRFAKKS